MATSALDRISIAAIADTAQDLAEQARVRPGLVLLIVGVAVVVRGLVHG